MYETCACVIHTILLSYMCISIVSHFTLICLRGLNVLREALVINVTNSTNSVDSSRKGAITDSYFKSVQLNCFL